MSQSGFVHLEECEIVAVSEKAVMVSWDDGEAWFPRSQIADGGDHLKKGMTGVTVSISEWIARKNGIDC